MFETGMYIIDVYVDPWEERTELGDIGDRVIYCKDCDNSELDAHGNRVCYEWDGAIVEDYEWCSRRVRRHDR